jgi:hypothetical protein
MPLHLSALDKESQKKPLSRTKVAAIAAVTLVASGVAAPSIVGRITTNRQNYQLGNELSRPIYELPEAKVADQLKDGSVIEVIAPLVGDLDATKFAAMIAPIAMRGIVADIISAQQPNGVAGDSVDLLPAHDLSK